MLVCVRVLCVCVYSCRRVVIVHYSFMCTLTFRICAITLDLYCLTKQHFVAANFSWFVFFSSSSLERILYI